MGEKDRTEEERIFVAYVLTRGRADTEGTLRGPRGPKNYLRYPSICIYGIAYILALLFVEMLKGRSHFKKGTLSTSGGRGSTPVPFLSPNLPDSRKWPKMTQNGPKWPKYDPKWPKIA